MYTGNRLKNGTLTLPATLVFHLCACIDVLCTYKAFSNIEFIIWTVDGCSRIKTLSPSNNKYYNKALVNRVIASSTVLSAGIYHHGRFVWGLTHLRMSEDQWADRLRLMWHQGKARLRCSLSKPALPTGLDWFLHLSIKRDDPEFGTD